MSSSLSSKVYICTKDLRTTGLSMNNPCSDDLRLVCQLCPVGSLLFPGSSCIYTLWCFCSHNKAHHIIEKSVITPWLKSSVCSSAVFYISSCFLVHFVATIVATPLRIVACALLLFSPQDLNSVYLTESSTQELEEIPRILHTCPRGH